MIATEQTDRGATTPPYRGSVLLVEDETHIRRMIALALRRAGYEVVQAGNGFEALGALEGDLPDLVLSDVMMPEMDGFGLLAWLRGNPRTRAVPVVLLTARGTIEDRITGLGLGADDYLVKPVEMTVLLARVRAKIDRPAVPREDLPLDRQNAVLGERAFGEELAREMALAAKRKQPGSLAYFGFEQPVGAPLPADWANVTGQRLLALRGPLDVVGRDAAGRFLLLMPQADPRAARRQLDVAQEALGAPLGDAVPRPYIGFAGFSSAKTPDQLRAQAGVALDQARAHRATQPLLYGAQAGQHPATPSRPLAESAAPAGKILFVEDEAPIRRMVERSLRQAGYEVATAANGREALDLANESRPNLIISDVMMPVMDGLQMLTALRADTQTAAIPVILLTARGATGDVVQGLELGADDYLTKPFEMRELLARVAVKMARPTVPSAQIVYDRQTALLRPAAFSAEVERELGRAAGGGGPGTLAVIGLDELPQVRKRLGDRAIRELVPQVAAQLNGSADQLVLASRQADDRFMLLLPATDATAAARYLDAVAQRVVGAGYSAGSAGVRLTPTIGFVTFSGAETPAQLAERAQIAMEHAAAHLDLRPVRYEKSMDAAIAQRKAEREAARVASRSHVWAERLRTPLQIATTVALGMVLPFFIYLGLAALGHDITPAMYIVVVVALLITGYLIWMEGLQALNPTQPPEEPASPYPPASAIIAAYMPNEAATIVETVEAFLKIDYPGELQIILAYNTPRDLPIEATLREIAARDPRFLPLRVMGSTSKAQNVNAALAQVRGEFVGVFDADHHPMPASFRRAWRWLSSGYDVVQGHCLVRNGDASWVARLVAVEFESIYAVSHPGRAKLHDFGIFGGSNGYWRTDLLRKTRMRGFMLTEDIDSSLRTIEAGYKIASDPYLISRELATVTLKATWNQRMRWAQGWFQVSLRHLWWGLRTTKLRPRQKMGLVHLLLWREIYPWLSWQMFPIIAFWAWRAGGLDRLDWVVPIFILTSLFTLSVGPGQVLFAWLLAAPEIRQRKKWFLFYLIVGSLFYTEYKNLIARVAQVKELMRERAWKVTPRAAAKEAPKEGTTA